MQVLAESLSPEATYRLMSGVVVPRPIAWITSQSPAGVVNLAPFSCFTFVSNKPPLIGVNIGRKAGVRKDTGANIHASGEFVINIGDATQLQAIHQSSEEHPADVSEVEVLGLATAASTLVRTPRLADVPVSMECRLERVIAFGETGAEFVVGEVLAFHIRDDLYQDGKVDTRGLNPVCRIGGPNYASLGEIVTLRAVAQTAKSVMSGNGQAG
ncbi:flavin reductase family protein [Cupriavidus sp. WS]|uniref:flavin reductase family protein n=1 Tax=Cupriavidus sp. WS TaxID=1312922 RepID=UPI000380DF39|nr:flavin reductase family protein [Cupriavidus sp. WS]